MAINKSIYYWLKIQKNYFIIWLEKRKIKRGKLNGIVRKKKKLIDNKSKDKLLKVMKTVFKKKLQNEEYISSRKETVIAVFKRVKRENRRMDEVKSCSIN